MAVSDVAHIAIVEQLDGKSVDWLEKVTDEDTSPQRPRDEEIHKCLQQ